MTAPIGSLRHRVAQQAEGWEMDADEADDRAARAMHEADCRVARVQADTLRACARVLRGMLAASPAAPEVAWSPSVASNANDLQPNREIQALRSEVEALRRDLRAERCTAAMLYGLVVDVSDDASSVVVDAAIEAIRRWAASGRDVEVKGGARHRGLGRRGPGVEAP